jgi:hypothetical protein
VNTAQLTIHVALRLESRIAFSAICYLLFR